MKALYTVLLVAGLLSSCANSDMAVREDASRFSAISVLIPAFQPQRGAAFAWYSPVVWASDTVPYTEALDAEITGLVEEAIISKGFRIAESIDEADYIIGGAIVDGESQQSDEVRDFFRLYPTLEAESGRPATSAMVGVIAAEDYSRVGSLRPNELLWRAGIKLIVVGERLSADEQHGRIRTLAAELLKSLPPGR